MGATLPLCPTARLHCTPAGQLHETRGQAFAAGRCAAGSEARGAPGRCARAGSAPGRSAPGRPQGAAGAPAQACFQGLGFSLGQAWTAGSAVCCSLSCCQPQRQRSPPCSAERAKHTAVRPGGACLGSFPGPRCPAWACPRRAGAAPWPARPAAAVSGRSTGCAPCAPPQSCTRTGVQGLGFSAFRRMQARRPRACLRHACPRQRSTPSAHAQATVICQAANASTAPQPAPAARQRPVSRKNTQQYSNTARCRQLLAGAALTKRPKLLTRRTSADRVCAPVLELGQLQVAVGQRGADKAPKAAGRLGDGGHQHRLLCGPHPPPALPPGAAGQSSCWRPR